MYMYRYIHVHVSMIYLHVNSGYNLEACSAMPVFESTWQVSISLQQKYSQELVSTCFAEQASDVT